MPPTKRISRTIVVMEDFFRVGCIAIKSVFASFPTVLAMIFFLSLDVNIILLLIFH